MNNIHALQNWSPCEELFSELKASNYAVLILNVPINFSRNQKVVLNLWSQAKVRILVDGGTRRWLHWLTENKYELNEVLNPDLITGDMDSLSKDVLNCFLKGNTTTVVTPNQDETDFTKALKELKKHCLAESIEIETVYVLADTSGRFDHIMANINTLYKSKDILTSINVYQVASSSITWILSPGLHSIIVPLSLRKKQEWCSLIPIGKPCIVTSTGLKWNLDKSKLEFGFLVSTSNTYDGSPVVTVQTDSPLVWSMGIEALL